MRRLAGGLGSQWSEGLADGWPRWHQERLQPEADLEKDGPAELRSE